VKAGVAAAAAIRPSAKANTARWVPASIAKHTAHGPASGASTASWPQAARQRATNPSQSAYGHMAPSPWSAHPSSRLCCGLSKRAPPKSRGRRNAALVKPTELGDS
jgi:hypothetical protein